MKFRTGDSIKVTIGKDKGRTGKIEKILVKGQKILVPGINMYKKHVKPMNENKGGVYDIPRPLSLGKVALVCPKCKKITRIGYKFVGQEKVRICKKCKKEIDIK